MGLSFTASRKYFGVEKAREQFNRIEQSLEDLKALRSSIEKISECREEAALNCFGVNIVAQGMI